MSLTLTVAPPLEPVSLTEAKAHLRVDASAEDQFVTSLITTSRLQVEAILGLALIQQSWLWRFDAWPAPGVVFPLRPITSIASVRTQNSDLSYTTVPPSNYILDGQGLPPRLVPVNAGFANPGAAALGIEITFTAGFGPAAGDVPAPLRQAILLLIAHWFETREPILADGTAMPRFPDAVTGLIEPYRMRRL
jgi:uncharacterized phiE125 gp8 family phage protein